MLIAMASNSNYVYHQSLKISQLILLLSLLYKFDRRNFLLLFLCLFSFGSVLCDTVENGLPFPYPDLSKCNTTYINYNQSDRSKNIEVPYTCCPPIPTFEIKPYKIPEIKVKRVRPAAHMVDENYIKKFMKVIQAMKDLNKNDPLSFYQQANVHCAYCNIGYTYGEDKEGNEIRLQVHSSWLFFPFHRWYLYFFEKIAGGLINDPSFALPYWNWDAPWGMTMPNMFVQKNSSLDPSKPNPLYDSKRNQAHLPPNILDLTLEESNTTNPQKIYNNHEIIYQQMVINATSVESFMGQPYYYGSQLDPGAGSFEFFLHNSVHLWTGTPKDVYSETPSYGEDMGSVYATGFDPMFYSHHANVDRMWRIWLDLGGKNFNDTAWLNTKFFFWDENSNPVYVTIQDCLDEDKLGYTYQPMELPWLKSKLRQKVMDTAKASSATA